ncbi:MAG TPA: DUF1622 domain-containing protein [Firmicutes bacterium]|nr:DUF1622 domain-containing protein [Bacillota bacterium]
MTASTIAQMCAVFTILAGIAKAFILYFRVLLKKSLRIISLIGLVRMEMGNSFSLALSFLIGASIIRTILAPTWDDIGKLAAIILLRTVLNYFLIRDVEKIRQLERSGENE